MTHCGYAQGVTDSVGKIVREDAKEKQHRTVIMKVQKRLNHGDERGYQKCESGEDQPAPSCPLER